MLKMIFGRAGTGKTYQVRKMLCDYAAGGKKGLCLIVPDQYSFETERAMLGLLGASNARSVEVFGFSRLCDIVFKLYGGKSLPEIDDGGKAVIMRLAIEDCADNIELFGKNLQSDDFVRALLQTAEEFKINKITPDALDEISVKTGGTTLSVKLRELSLIMRAYNAGISKEYFDPSEKMDLLYEKILQNRYFEGKTVVFDSFFTFTEQQLKIVELAICQAREVTVTFGCPSLSDENPVFSEIKNHALRLITIANKNGCEVAEPVILTENRRFTNEELEFVEKGIFSPYFEEYNDNCRNVTLCEAKTRYDEADYVARTIVSLTRERGYRYRDFAVIARDDDFCKNAVDAALEKYGIEYFADRRMPLKYQPLIRYVLSLLRFCQSFSGDALFAMLKTGISDLSVEEISELENYVFTWNISGKRWFEEFTLNPDGFQEEFSDGQKERLVEVNRIRKKAIVPVQKVISRLKSIKTGEEISACIYEYLENNEIPKNLAAAASDDAEAEIFSQVWDCLMGILDQLAVSVSGRRIDLPKYISLFELVVASKTIGSIPQRIDEVNVGNAERMRPASPKVVFIVGANDRIFPKIPSAGGLLTDSDRSELIKNGVKIKDGGENEMIRERALAYNAVCAASDMLFVTWSESDSSGTALYPSQIVTDILKIFPKIRVYREKAYLEKEDRECLEPIASPLPALEAEALCGGKSTVFSDSLRTALLQLDETSETLKRIEEFSKLLPETVSREHAKELFGGDRQLSPTSIERFFRCPFRYFCMYGMKAKARCTTEMDNKNRGTLVHYCLEQLITKFGSDGLKSMTERDIQQQVTVLLQKYLDTALGGEENKTSRFKRNYMMTSQLIKKLAVMIAGEFSEGNFKAAYCELEIGNSMSSKVRPIEIRTEDQSVISVTGFIDRVDTCDCGGKTLIRVIDYKTGRKSLDATDLYNGLNLQMPLYLFTLCRNGEELFSGERIPAAVLYVRAADKIINTLRSEDDSSLEEKFRKEMKFNGIVLNDEDVIDSIDESRSGKYLKLKYSEKDGKISGGSCTVSYEEMKGIEKRIEELLLEMNRELKNGNIWADPVDDSENGCKYCDYESVCKKQRGDPHRKAVKVKGFDFKNGGKSDE